MYEAKNKRPYSGDSHLYYTPFKITNGFSNPKCKRAATADQLCKKSIGKCQSFQHCLGPMNSLPSWVPQLLLLFVVIKQRQWHKNFCPALQYLFLTRKVPYSVGPSL